MTFADIGFGNVVNTDRIVSIVSAEAAPTKRMISSAKEKGLAVDATCGKKTKTVLVMDSGHVILSAKSSERILQKIDNPGMQYPEGED